MSYSINSWAIITWMDTVFFVYPFIQVLKKMIDALIRLLTGRGSWEPLQVEYDSKVNGFWGDLRLNIQGDGQVTQQVLRIQIGQPLVKVASAALIKQIAWEPSHDAKP